MQKESSDPPFSDSEDEEFEAGADSADDRRGTNIDVDIDEKDSEEETLERLVLGGKAAFREQLFKDAFLFDGGDSSKETQLVETQSRHRDGLDDLDDSALFFLDTGDDAARLDSVVGAKALAGELKNGIDQPAWEDSDDERLTISLAGASRLRKLRISEAEDVVSGAEYTRRLRQQYLRLYPLPEWAKTTLPEAKRRRRSSASLASSGSSGSEEASDGEPGSSSTLPLEAFLRNAASFSGAGAKKRKKLRPEVIDIQRTRDIPDSYKGPVTSLAFHPRYPILLSSSTSSLLFLHHVDPTAHPTPNPPLTSVQVKRTPIRHAEFLHPQGDEIVMAGRRKYFHSWNLSSGLVKEITRIQGHRLEQKTTERFRLSPCGRFMALIASDRKGGGKLNILNVDTMQWTAQARIDSRGGIADFAWWNSGDGLTILGRDGQVAEWSMTSKRCIGTWRDEGSIGGTVMALGGKDGGPPALGGARWIALGSNSGVVNVYDRNELIASSSTEEVEIKALPAPARCFEQLTTPATDITFTPDGQLLAFASKHKKDALRLAHLPSCTIYRNWPTAQTPLGRITAVAFGSESNILAVGNDVGKVRLWEIRS